MVDSGTFEWTHGVLKGMRGIGIKSGAENDVPAVVDLVNFWSPKLKFILVWNFKNAKMKISWTVLELTSVLHGSPLSGSGLKRSFVSAVSQLSVKERERLRVMLSLVEYVNRYQPS